MSMFFNSGQISWVLLDRRYLAGLNSNKFSLSFNREVFRMIRASLDYSGSGIHVIS